jgi:hypothetical protein
VRATTSFPAQSVPKYRLSGARNCSVNEAKYRYIAESQAVSVRAPSDCFDVSCRNLAEGLRKPGQIRRERSGQRTISSLPQRLDLFLDRLVLLDVPLPRCLESKILVHQRDIGMSGAVTALPSRNPREARTGRSGPLRVLLLLLLLLLLLMGRRRSEQRPARSGRRGRYAIKRRSCRCGEGRQGRWR